MQRPWGRMQPVLEEQWGGWLLQGGWTVWAQISAQPRSNASELNLHFLVYKLERKYSGPPRLTLTLPQLQ